MLCGRYTCALRSIACVLRYGVGTLVPCVVLPVYCLCIALYGRYTCALRSIACILPVYCLCIALCGRYTCALGSEDIVLNSSESVTVDSKRMFKKSF